MADQVLILQVRDSATVRRDIGVESTTIPGDWAARVLDPDVASILSDILTALQGGGIVVSATNFDIRNLAFATDTVDVSGSTVSDGHPDPQLDALTDAELRASAVPVDTGLTPQTDALTDTELRASPVPVADNGDSLTVDQPTHDNLNANANIQVGNADVANENPVPVSDAGGSLTVDGDLGISDMPLSVETVLQNAATANGNGTAMLVSGYGSVALELSGTSSSDVFFEGSRDGGATYHALHGIQVVGSDSYIRSGTSFVVSLFRAPVNGLTHVRARIANYLSGSVTVKGIAAVPTFSLDPAVPPEISSGDQLIGGILSAVGYVSSISGGSQQVKVAHLDMTAATTTTIVAGVPSKKIRVLEYSIDTNEPATATVVNFARGAGTTRVTGSPLHRLNADKPFVERNSSDGRFLMETAAGEALRVTQDGAADISVAIVYIEVD